MLRVGLTGSIGMGKSTTADMFRAEGIAVLDSDQLVHELYRGPAALEIERVFPGVVVDGAVDRQRLAARVLNDPSALKRLENIVHPMVWAARDALVEERRRKGDRIVVFDIPLLFETGAEKDFDAIVVATAVEDVQKTRVLARKGMTAEKFASILSKQTPDSEKRARADFVVHTDKGLDAAREEVRNILKALKAHLET
ncbi:MAG: dephospho-CoA kinase [Methylocystis sp.]|nr:dephospho-CoA kinase [Methylocystis sp.]